MWQTMWCHPQASENGMGQGTDHALPQHPQLHLSVCGSQRGSRWSCTLNGMLGAECPVATRSVASSLVTTCWRSCRRLRRVRSATKWNGSLGSPVTTPRDYIW